tara:strand:- start:5307 stop:5684 length:378 start_codon:yes stop_codon:yes gene_type:complete
MPEINLIHTLQLVVGVGLLNVWLMRGSRSTAYRGGSSQTLKDEFAAYGLPTWFFYLVGVLKVGSGIALIVGLWVPALSVPAASLVAGLMLGALAMHIKVKDPAMKSLPALLMLIMSAMIAGLSVG